MVDKVVKGKARANLSRREFIKYGAKVGFWAGIYGTFGGAIGRAYQGIIDSLNFTGQKLAELDDKFEESKTGRVVKKPQEFRSNIYGRFFGRTEEDQAEWRGDHGIYTEKDRKEGYKVPDDQPQATRRGFFRALLDYTSRNPVKSGAAIGAAYGGGKAVIKGYGGYKQGKRYVGLKEENAGLREDVDELKIKIDELKKGKHEGLEDKVEGVPGKKQGKQLGLFVGGIVLLVFSFIYLTSNITGFAVNNSLNESFAFDTMRNFTFSFLGALVLLWGSIKLHKTD